MGSGSPRVTLCGVPVNKGLRPSHLHLMTGTCMHQHQGWGWILLSPEVPSLHPNMPSACHHHALDGAYCGSPDLHCTVPGEPPLGPSEAELRRGAGEWDYPVTKGD